MQANLTQLKLAQIKDEIDYKISNKDLPLPFGNQLLTVKKSENYFIFTYYSKKQQKSEFRTSKFEIHYTPHMIHNYRAVIDHPDFLEDKTDKNKLLFTDFIKQMQTCIIYYHNLTATVKPGGIRQLD